jgi:DNA-binding IclR family transcriptional regulator
MSKHRAKQDLNPKVVRHTILLHLIRSGVSATPTAIARATGVPLAIVRHALSDMASRGTVVEAGGRYREAATDR